MKFDKTGTTEHVHFPIDETGEIMAVMERAEKKGNLKALQWCARRLLWIYKIMLEKDGTCGSDAGTLFFNGEDDGQTYTVRKFNRAYKSAIKDDPLPEAAHV
jgi:hypothetical protein